MIFQEYLSKEYGVLLNNLIISYILFADDLILFSETPEDLLQYMQLQEKYQQGSVANELPHEFIPGWVPQWVLLVENVLHSVYTNN